MDSMGKPPSGLSSGTVADLGNYDQCLAVVAPNGDDEVDYTGKLDSNVQHELASANFLRAIVQDGLLQET